MRKILPYFSLVALTCVFLFSCADMIENQLGIKNNSVVEGEPPKNTTTYFVYKAQTDLSTYRSEANSYATTGNYYSDYTLSVTKAAAMLEKFEYENSYMTEDEIVSFLGSGIPSSAISSFLGGTYSYLAHPISSSDVRILLKTPVPDGIKYAELSVDDSVSGMAVLSWELKNYSSDYVYIWMDGQYKTSVSSSTYTHTLSSISSGEHTFVLKAGSSDSAFEISNTVTTDSKSNNIEIKSSSPQTADDFSYSYVSYSGSSKTLTLTKGNIYALTAVDKNRNASLISEKYDSSSLIYKTKIAVSDPSGNSVTMYTSPDLTSGLTTSTSDSVVYIMAEQTGAYTITQSSYSSYYSGITGIHIYAYFDISSASYSLSGVYNPYDSQMTFSIGATSRISSDAFIKFIDGSTTSSYGTDVSSLDEFSVDLEPGTRSSTSYIFFIVNSSGKAISNYFKFTLPKLTEVFSLSETNLAASSSPRLEISGEENYTSSGTLAGLYRRTFTIGTNVTSDSDFTSHSTFTGTSTDDTDASVGTLYAYYAAASNGERISNYTLGAIPDGIYTTNLSGEPQLINQFQVVGLKSSGYTIYKTRLPKGSYSLKVATKTKNPTLLSSYANALEANIYVYSSSCTYVARSTSYYNTNSFSVSKEDYYYIVCSKTTSDSTTGTCAFALYNSQ